MCCYVLASNMSRKCHLSEHNYSLLIESSPLRDIRQSFYSNKCESKMSNMSRSKNEIISETFLNCRIFSPCRRQILFSFSGKEQQGRWVVGWMNASNGGESPWVWVSVCCSPVRIQCNPEVTGLIDDMKVQCIMGWSLQEKCQSDGSQFDQGSF